MTHSRTVVPPTSDLALRREAFHSETIFDHRRLKTEFLQLQLARKNKNDDALMFDV